jgi:penicillin-binding protein 1A
MSEDWPYTEEELREYFNNPDLRRVRATRASGSAAGRAPEPPSGGILGFLYRRLGDQRKVQAAVAVSVLAGLFLLGVAAIGLFLFTLGDDDLPSLEQLENPALQLATIAYSADGVELARYARQNRSSVTGEEISQNVINALIATEDHRFYDHWGIDLFRFHIAAIKTALGDVQGGSTISMQLARNLYNKEIGKEQTISRKLKEMVTAVELERRYTKDEIVEMYLNTVEFGNNAFGIEAAARTFFNRSAAELDTLQSATLVGMLKAITAYNPLRNPDNARRRRNVVLGQMIKHGYLSEDYLDEHAEMPVTTDFNPNEITRGPAPYFAEYVRQWLNDWSEAEGNDFYADGLYVFTTLDSRLQELAGTAVENQMVGLQAVVDFEWGQRRGGRQSPFSTNVEDYVKQTNYVPWSHFWRVFPDTLRSFVRESDAFRQLVHDGLSESAAMDSLYRDETFMSALKNDKSRLEAGLVSIDPRNGYVKAWVGGRNLADDWYDHVAKARRQPGSTFKPFVYIAAIDNGYSPQHTFKDTLFYWSDSIGNEWSPTNSDGSYTNRWMTLREGLKYSLNTITGQLVLQVGAPTVADYARWMGIRSPLNEVPSLALGTSNVTLLELTTAYSTLANGGLYYEPTVVTRIEDQLGNVLYEARPQPNEALSDQTAFKVIDMMREVVQTGGTGARIRWQYQLHDYDFAGKTGTTQNSADGWFMLMHPELVTGAWVGWNDQRMTFRTNWWGQGAHNALFLVGDYTRKIVDDGRLSKENFPLPIDFGNEASEETLPTPSRDNRRVIW